MRPSRKMMLSRSRNLRAFGGMAVVEGLENRQLFAAAALTAVPGIPSDPTPATGASLTAAPAVLDWADTPGATNYDVVQDGVDLGFTPISQINLATVPADGSHSWHVTAINSGGTVTGPTWTYSVDTSAPVVTGLDAPNLTSNAGSTYTFTVTYADNIGIKASTIATGNVLVTGGGLTTQSSGLGNGGFTETVISADGDISVIPVPQAQTPAFSQYATLVSVDNAADGTPRTATYSISAPANGTFPLGVYTLELNQPTTSASFITTNNFFTTGIPGLVSISSTVLTPSVPVTDLTGNPAPIQRIGTFEVSNGAPTISISAPTVASPGAEGADFTATITEPSTTTSLDAAHFNVGSTGDFSVLTPTGQVVPATITGVVDPVDDSTGLLTTATVTYHIDAPDGSFTSTDNGTYRIILNSEQIGDASNTNNFTPAGTVATLAVDVPTVVGFTQTAAAVQETSLTPAPLTVTRSGSTALALTVNYTVSGTAVAGQNYVALSGQVTIPPGSTSADIDVQPILTPLFTADKSLTITLQPAAGIQLDANSAATVTIIEVPPAVVTVSNVTANEPLIGTPGNMVFTLTLSKASSATVTVPFTTSNGSAVAGVNYIAKQGTVAFAPGQTTATVSVPLIGDLVNRANLTVLLNLGIPTNATQGNLIAVGTIINLPLRSMTFNSAHAVNYLDTAGNAVTATMSGPGNGTLVFRGDIRQPTDALELIIRGATTTSTATLKSKKPTSVKILAVNGDLGTLAAGNLIVTSSVAFNGSIKIATLGTLRNASVTFNQGFVMPTFSVGVVQNSSISSQVPIKSLQFVRWQDTDATPDVISAPEIDALTTTLGFGADVNVDGDLGTVKIGGGLSGSKINAGGSIGDVTVGAISHSSLTAGVQINSLTVKSSGFGGFASSNIQSPVIGTLKLGSIDPSNGGVQFGVFTGSVTSISGTLPQAGTFNFKNPVVLDTTDLENEGDFVFVLQGV